MRCNEGMRNILKDGIPREINLELQKIINSGFEVREGCYFFSALFDAAKNVARSDFQDCTGCECFVNSIHVEDYVDDDILRQAIKFSFVVFSAWRKLFRDVILISVINVDDFSVVAKYHVKRPGESWVGEDLEGYEDPIMVMDSSEDIG